MLDNYFNLCHLLIVFRKPFLEHIILMKKYLRLIIRVTYSLVQDQALRYVIVLTFCKGYRQMTLVDSSKIRLFFLRSTLSIELQLYKKTIQKYL